MNFVPKESYESQMRETVAFSSLFPSTKDKMAEIFFWTSFNMYFNNILKSLLETFVSEFLNTSLFKFRPIS